MKSKELDSFLYREQYTQLTQDVIFAIRLLDEDEEDSELVCSYDSYHYACSPLEHAIKKLAKLRKKYPDRRYALFKRHVVTTETMVEEYNGTIAPKKESLT